MLGTDLLTKTLGDRFPGAGVEVELGDSGYEVKVVSDRFDGKSRADREAEVYAAFGRMPLSLLAKIKTIKAVTADGR